jgi:hypothetical protein
MMPGPLFFNSKPIVQTEGRFLEKCPIEGLYRPNRRGNLRKVSDRKALSDKQDREIFEKCSIEGLYRQTARRISGKCPIGWRYRTNKERNL